MKVVYHHLNKTAMWEDAVLTGTEYMIEYLLDVTRYHRAEVPLTLLGPYVQPSMWTHEGAIAAGLVAKYRMTGDQTKASKIPEGSVS